MQGDVAVGSSHWGLVMTKLLLIGLASVGFNTAELPGLTEPTCTATVSGPTYGFSGRMYFHFTTKCDAPVAAITIKATVAGPFTTAVGAKTCSLTDTCSSLVAVTYKRGTWTWSNNTTYTGGTSLATQSLTFFQ
jgi:hypothetical protein